MPTFQLGRVVGTPAALAALEGAGIAAQDLLRRHGSGDWGELCDEDRHANGRAVRDGGRVLSTYCLAGGAVVWVITEADRSATTLLLPEDY